MVTKRNREWTRIDAKKGNLTADERRLTQMKTWVGKERRYCYGVEKVSEMNSGMDGAPKTFLYVFLLRLSALIRVTSRPFAVYFTSIRG